MDATVFEVEEAGCESCAALVRDAIEEAVTVLEVTVDESADLATVRVTAGSPVSEAEVDALLRRASPEGHSYRVKPGSWRTAWATASSGLVRVQPSLDGELGQPPTILDRTLEATVACAEVEHALAVYERWGPIHFTRPIHTMRS